MKVSTRETDLIDAMREIADWSRHSFESQEEMRGTMTDMARVAVDKWFAAYDRCAAFNNAAWREGNRR
jgi:hypothetical protein